FYSNIGTNKSLLSFIKRSSASIIILNSIVLYFLHFVVRGNRRLLKKRLCCVRLLKNLKTVSLLETLWNELRIVFVLLRMSLRPTKSCWLCLENKQGLVYGVRIVSF